MRMRTTNQRRKLLRASQAMDPQLLVGDKLEAVAGINLRMTRRKSRLRSRRGAMLRHSLTVLHAWLHA